MSSSRIGQGSNQMNEAATDLLRQVDQHLSQPNQAWLLGAGISKDAGLPLMNDLTTQVLNRADGITLEILEKLRQELPKTCHIEHILSQLGDYTAIAKRVALGKVKIGDIQYATKDLEEAHDVITSHIAYVIRWGYIPKNESTDENIGSPNNIIVSIEHHRKFLRALYEKRQAGLREPRRPVHFFTTNYDTLLEDALALGRYAYWDGFSGGAVAFREHRFGQPAPSDGLRAKVIKLHGSIDWIMGEDDDVWRVRNTDLYPARKETAYIYPQSTKYVATQKDPFAAQFSMLRDLISSSSELVLAICGYSFGDEHINEEIERAISAQGNKTTIISFCLENCEGIPATLERWRNSPWGKRIYTLTQKGLYWSDQGPFHQKPVGEHDWWSFQGVTTFLEEGGAENY